ncbi:MAG: hypothetical protein R6U52_02495 [Kosmotogaceae bacterium]
MKNPVLLCIFLLMIFTISFAQENYVPFNPYPHNNSVIIPMDEQVRLSWRCLNPYQKTVTYKVKLLINGIKEITFEDLRTNSIKIDVKSGDELKWSVIANVYEESYYGPSWTFRIPEELMRTYGVTNNGSFADVSYSGNSFNVIVNQIIQGQYNPKVISIENSGNFLKEKNLHWNNFYAHLIVDNKLIGHTFDENGYKLGIYNLTNDTTSFISDEYFSSIHEIKEIEDGFIVTGINNQKSKVLLLDKRLEPVDKYSSEIIGYSSDHMKDYLLVAGKKRVKDIYVPAIAFKKNEEQWVDIALEISGVFTDCKITNDGLYVMGQIPSSYEGRQDLIIRKYDLSGNLLWSNSIDNYGDDIPGELTIEDDCLKVLGTYYTNESYSSYIVNYTADGKTAGVNFFESEFNEFPARLISTKAGNFIFGNIENDYGRRIFMRFIGN